MEQTNLASLRLASDLAGIQTLYDVLLPPDGRKYMSNKRESVERSALHARR